MKFVLGIVLLAAVIIVLDARYDSLPRFLRPIVRGWRKFSHALGYIMNTLLLCIVWVFIIGAYSLIGRFLRFFQSKKKTNTVTYWEDAPAVTDIHFQS